MSRGYVVLATNNAITDYVKCAEALAMSVLWVMPRAKISLITDQPYNNVVFDQIIQLPHGNLARSEWQLENDWQIWEASPTTKLLS